MKKALSILILVIFMMGISGDADAIFTSEVLDNSEEIGSHQQVYYGNSGKMPVMIFDERMIVLECRYSECKCGFMEGNDNWIQYHFSHGLAFWDVYTGDLIIFRISTTHTARVNEQGTHQWIDREDVI